VEHAQEAKDGVAAVGPATWRHELGIAIAVVDGGDVLEDHVFGVERRTLSRPLSWWLARGGAFCGRMFT
jgi:hypothetical protein